ncbi:MAG: hypothetical protein KGH70_08745 [Rhodospirillales bacterium]|nr:hypothetical protein [Rhodospirillales bacterium]
MQLGLLPAVVNVCKEGANTPCEYQTTYNVSYYGIRWIIRELAYFNGLITALAGCAVAWFTYTLWRSTEKLWRSAEVQRDTEIAAHSEEIQRFEASLAVSKASAEAAKINAEASLGVELPRIEIASASLVLAQDQTSGRARIYCRNIGRTDAAMIDAGFVITEDPLLCEPMRIPWDNAFMFEVGCIWRGDGPDKGEYVSLPQEGRLTNNQIKKLTTDGYLWLFGYVAYRDFLGVYWRSKICLRSRKNLNSFTWNESYDYPSYTGRERYDPSKPNPYLIDPLLNHVTPSSAE